MANKQYPNGKLNADDQGVLNISLRIEGDAVVLDFGKMVSWVGMDKATAISVADTIKAAAETL